MQSESMLGFGDRPRGRPRDVQESPVFKVTGGLARMMMQEAEISMAHPTQQLDWR